MKKSHTFNLPSESGRLILIGTPIGNLDDLSRRAAETLAEADVICCEDTRRTGRLLMHIGVRHRPQLLRIDDHTETSAIPKISQMLTDGLTVVLVSDAGMPILCDPGQRLVAEITAAGYPVSVVPGPSAGLTALVVSGLPATRHVFEGYLPRKGINRTKRLKEIALESRTVILFEAPHRLHACLNDLVEVCGGDRRAVIARELTKMHEELIRGTLQELAAWAKEPVKGEIVVVFEGTSDESDVPSDEKLREAILESLRLGLSRRDTATEVAKNYRVPRRRVYNLTIDTSVNHDLA